MSWKPSRSSCILFDRYTAQSNKYRELLIQAINSNEFLSYSKIKEVSKFWYLYWLNDNKASCNMSGTVFNKNNPKYGLEFYALNTQLFNVYTKNKHLTYKPIQPLL
jgi:hypothetical protein